MNRYRLDHVDGAGNLYLGGLREYDDDVEAKKRIQPLADYWKHHGHKVIISRVLDSGVCITI